VENTFKNLFSEMGDYKLDYWLKFCIFIGYIKADKE
jgi:hypothetical protein